MGPETQAKGSGAGITILVIVIILIIAAVLFYSNRGTEEVVPVEPAPIEEIEEGDDVMMEKDGDAMEEDGEAMEEETPVEDAPVE